MSTPDQLGLDPAVLDRARGVLLATAAGDALGVPYELATPPAPGVLAAMTGGGLDIFAPGEWSDDTSMAVAIAEVAATGADLRTPEALDSIADGFLRWYDGGPPDIGIQTRAVLGATRCRLDAGESREIDGRAASPLLTSTASCARRRTRAYA